MAKSKTFKIGEYAIGGIIQVNITGKVIIVQALDWNTKKEVSKGSAMSDEDNVRHKLTDYLNELTSHYYAEQIFDWIESNVDLKTEFGF
jgi:hypothetical protein